MMNYWLCKQEPSTYNLDLLQKEKTATWDGVHNNLAIKHINSMKKGDQAFFYHSGDEKQIVGIMEITSNPYPNPKEKNPRFVVVDVKYKKRLENPVTLAQIKTNPKFKNWELLRISRLSVMPVPTQIWSEILKISQK
ncbi:EVE domain-containing protein [Candidatus Nitrosotenuis aquarius]|uniref:EVE domain-containing protein n=1 Tax=Candidatus Nitrosotenuis aquarius TaxID=1846278 RepID=UPI000C1ECA35|nr:EVE domain-containing protein [Candidatus Nitrosotenuis aquarius]